MTEEIICQKFTYAEINVYKNYTNIEHGPKLSKGWDNKRKNINEIWDFATSTGSSSNTQYVRLYIPYAKRATKFFRYMDEHSDMDKTAKVQGIGRTIYTQDSNIIKRAYNNPFMSVRMVTKERTIKQVGDKITIKDYARYRFRNVNNRYFGKNTQSISLSINLKTGNFICVDYLNCRGLTRKKFRTNSFEMISSMIRNLYSLNMDDGNVLWGEYTKSMNTYQFIDKLNRTLNMDLPNVDLPHNRKFNSDFSRLILNQIVEKFVELKKIKVPDNDFSRYLIAYYPTEKFFKKNDRKLIASVLDLFGIKSKFTIKLLHSVNSLEFGEFVYMCKLFGDDYLDYITKIKLDRFEVNHVEDLSTHIQKTGLMCLIQTFEELNITHLEKQNFVKIINDPEFKSRKFSGLFIDHIAMIRQLKKYFPNIKMNAKNGLEFNNEHASFSVLINSIKKGYYNALIYEEEMIKIMEKPITTTLDGVTTHFTPFILKTEMEYKEEGMYMHHCVGGYSGKESSIIVSLRDNKEDRVTSEFSVDNGRCVQSRYYHNTNPPEHFLEALEIIRRRAINLSAGENILKSIELKKIPFNFKELTGSDVPTEPENYENMLEMQF